MTVGLHIIARPPARAAGGPARPLEDRSPPQQVELHGPSNSVPKNFPAALSNDRIEAPCLSENFRGASLSAMHE
jgi:hypothetical protein